MPLPCTYILQCLLHTKKNTGKFNLNTDVDNYRTAITSKSIFVWALKLQITFSLSIKLYNKLPVQEEY